MKNARFEDLVTCLSGDQPPRVWSLLVTVFGELAQRDGAGISGSLLRSLTERIGFTPEAVRVALHRLRKDGWIESRRQGRNSTYFLTERGRALSAEASPRIYGDAPPAERAWLVVHEPGQSVAPDTSGGAWVTSNLSLSSRPIADPAVFATPLHASTPLPVWMRNKLGDDATCLLARKLIRALSEIEASNGALDRLSALERAVIRILIVHDWRRIVLKTPDLPDHVFPVDWPGAECRRKVLGILQQVPQPDLDTLEQWS